MAAKWIMYRTSAVRCAMSVSVCESIQIWYRRFQCQRINVASPSPPQIRCGSVQSDNCINHRKKLFRHQSDVMVFAVSVCVCAFENVWHLHLNWIIVISIVLSSIYILISVMSCAFFAMYFFYCISVINFDSSLCSLRIKNWFIFNFNPLDHIKCKLTRTFINRIMFKSAPEQKKN